jgi:hypothetical protein
VTRSDIQVTFTWTVNQGGEVQSQSTTSTLQPVDPAAFPPELAPLVDQWNAGLANLNARLDSAFAPEVIASFPAAFTLRLTDAGDPNRFIEGLFDEYDKFLFLGDMSGDAAGSDQGGGAALVVSSVDGQIDRAAKTARGKIARTLLILLVGVPDSAAALTAQISVDFTATRIGDAAAQ